MKGLHLSIDGWWHDQDEHGWKLASVEEYNKDVLFTTRAGDGPSRVVPVSRSYDDVDAL